MKPKVEELGSRMDSVYFILCDVDELEDLEEASDVTGVPTFIFQKNGKKLAEFSGANEGKLIKTIEELQ